MQLSQEPLVGDAIFNINLCIICQKSTKDAVTSSEKGRMQVTDAAAIRNDDILKRINMLEGKPFVYHSTNSCYKTYTMKSTLQLIQKKRLASSGDDSLETAVDTDVPAKKMRYVWNVIFVYYSKLCHDDNYGVTAFSMGGGG